MYIYIYIYMTERTHRRHPATESAHAHVPRRRQLLTRACRKSRGRARDRKRSASCPRQLQPAPCACAPNAASGSHSGCRAARGCSQRTCGQHQSAEHMGRRRRRHCRCARPVPPNASLRLAAPTERLPGGRQRHPTTSLRGPRPSTDASTSPLPATSPAAPRPAAPSPSAATATPGRVGRATRACGCSCASSSAAIRPGSSVGALCELRAPCAPPKPSSLSGPLPKPPGSAWGTSARCSPPRPRARSWSLAPPRSAAPRSPLTPSARSRPLAPPHSAAAHVRRARFRGFQNA